MKPQSLIFVPDVKTPEGAPKKVRPKPKSELCGSPEEGTPRRRKRPEAALRRRRLQKAASTAVPKKPFCGTEKAAADADEDPRTS